MKKFTFLEKEQICGNKQLDIINKYGKKCIITDFSILLGGNVRIITNKEEQRKLTLAIGGQNHQQVKIQL